MKFKPNQKQAELLAYIAKYGPVENCMVADGRTLMSLWRRNLICQREHGWVLTPEGEAYVK